MSGLVGGRVRRSTIVLVLVFLASCVTYALVRPPAPEAQIVSTTRSLRPQPAPPTREPVSVVPGVPEERATPSPSAVPSPASPSPSETPSPVSPSPSATAPSASPTA